MNVQLLYVLELSTWPIRVIANSFEWDGQTPPKTSEEIYEFKASSKLIILSGFLKHTENHLRDFWRIWDIRLLPWVRAQVYSDPREKSILAQSRTEPSNRKREKNP